MSLNTVGQNSTKSAVHDRPLSLAPGFSGMSVWAFSIGTSIGWGSLMVTCNTYLVKAGVMGTILGLLLGSTLAVGISDYIMGEDESVLDVFSRADRLMYQRKTEMKQVGSAV